MIRLPEAFLKRVQQELGEAYPQFLSVYDRPAERGLRVNTLKLSCEQFKAISPFALEPIAWEKSGFYLREEKPGAHPYHFAGLYYLQEPSAMSAVPLLEIEPGERVLDLCSAPGGKGTQMAGCLNGSGLLVLNEKVPDRARILSQNVERMGIQNAIVLNESPETLAPRFAHWFDKILVDAPCSGEGMFRKEENAVLEWSAENTEMCARRQAGILDAAAEMLAGGGTLVYSTCTFAEIEDEAQVEGFLKRHPEFSLTAWKKLWPHQVRGEGHFVAQLKKRGADRAELRPQKAECGREETLCYRAFEQTFCRSQMHNLHRAGDALYALPDGCFSLQGLHVLRAGIKLGTWKKGRFEPDHAFAMAMRKEDALLTFDTNAEGILPYLRGEPVSGAGSGWCLVCVDGYAVGLGKAVNGVIKNHYPKGLRLRQA